MNTEMLMSPLVSELSDQEKDWVTVAQAMMTNDFFYATGGFSLAVSPSFMGFYLDRKERKAVPVYNTHNGIYAVEKNIAGSVSNSRVTQDQVYQLESNKK